MLKDNSLSGRLPKIVLCFCAIPVFPFLVMFFVKAYIYVQQHHISFLSYLLLYPAKWYLCYFLPIALLFFIGALISFTTYKYKSFSCRNIIFLILALVLFEQTLQFIVVKYHDTIGFTIIDGWLKISPVPVLNAENYISIKDIIKVDLDNALFDMYILIISYFGYRACYFWLPGQWNLLKISIAFLFAGMFGASFNKYIYNHGYDFIEIEYMAVFDIKDIYFTLWSSTVFLLLAEAAPFLKKVKNYKQKIYEYFKWELAFWRDLRLKFKFFSDKYFKR